MWLATYTPNTEPPINPSSFSTYPASPSRESHQPLVFATPPAYLSKIYFYKDSLCTLPVGSGSSEELKATGILISLSANTQSDVYAISEEAFGLRSSCE